MPALPASSLWSGASIDAAAVDSRTMLAGRQIVAVVAAAIVGANLGFATALAWWVAVICTEFWAWAATRRQAAGKPGSATGRVSYLLSMAAITTTWSAVCVLYWLTGEVALQITAIILVAAQLNHAQSFGFRSLPVLLINAGIPAASMVVLPLFVSHFTASHRATLAFSLLLSLGYIAASARANRVAAARLEATQDELEKMVYLDALTLLGNRRLFAENLRKLILASNRQGRKFALLMIDLDRFKSINDNLGHAVGDALLVEVGARLRRAVRAVDHVARTGGDEFAILLADTHDPAEIETACRRIADSFIESFELDGVRIDTSLSFGVAVYPADGEAEDDLLKSADLALYEAKNSGRNTWRYCAVARTA